MSNVKFFHMFVNGVEYKRCSFHKKYEPIIKFISENKRWDNKQAYCKEGFKKYRQMKKEELEVTLYNVLPYINENIIKSIKFTVNHLTQELNNINLYTWGCVTCTIEENNALFLRVKSRGMFKDQEDLKQFVFKFLSEQQDFLDEGV